MRAGWHGGRTARAKEGSYQAQRGDTDLQQYHAAAAPRLECAAIQPYNALPTAEVHTISVLDLARILEYDSHNHDYLKEALKALVTCGVEWNILGKDGTEVWGVSTLLAHAEIELACAPIRTVCPWATPS